MKLNAIISNGEIVWDSSVLEISKLSDFEGMEVEVEIKKVKKTRSSLQNRSLHLWFTQLAEALNDSGQDMRAVIRQELPIKWTDYNVKEYLFRPTMKYMFGKKSTAHLTTKEIDEVYAVVDRTIAERTGVHVDWPCIENLINNY